MTTRSPSLRRLPTVTEIGPRRLLGVGILALLVAVVAWHRLALSDLRRVEAGYVSARQATTCAVAGLERFGDPGDIDAALTDAVRTASEQVLALRRSLDDAVVPYPSLASARSAVADALDTQDSFYSALLDDPQGTDDELEALGERNREAERALASARGWLATGVGGGWTQRAACP